MSIGDGGALPKTAEVSEELAMRAAVTAWGRARWPDCRVLHELAMGERRIDLVFVAQSDLIGVEIKSGRDRLDRLDGQMKEYGRYLPEVWVAVAPRWRDHEDVIHRRGNLLVVPSTGNAFIQKPAPGERPYRDELVCSRVLELLWYDEAARIAVRTDVVPHRVPKQFRKDKLLKLLARLLTGNQILTEVCRELRERSRAGGWRSDAPLRELEVPDEVTSG
jgi:hypothetical protein